MICSVCREEVKPSENAMRYPDGRAVHVRCIYHIERDYKRYRADRMAEQAKRQRGYSKAERKRMREQGRHIGEDRE